MIIVITVIEERAKNIMVNLEKEDMFFKNVDLLSKVRKIAESGNLEKAEMIANSISDEEIRAEAFSTISSMLVKAGELEKAELLIISIDTSSKLLPIIYEKVCALLGIASYWERLDNYDKVVKLMEQAQEITTNIQESNWQKAECLCRIGEKLANVKQISMAVSVWNQAVKVGQKGFYIADNLQDEEDCKGVLLEIVSNMKRVGLTKQANELEKFISSELI